MSRVGKRILQIPVGVELVLHENNNLIVRGPQGVLERSFSPLIKIIQEGNILRTERSNEQKSTRQLHGTTNSLISAMLRGVVEHFERRLLIQGVGYRATLTNNVLELLVGYSHSVRVPVPSNLSVSLISPTEISIRGADKQAVGQYAAIIRRVREPNPYSGKGISYVGERIRRKEGKKASK